MGKPGNIGFYALGKAILAEGMTIGRWWEKSVEDWPALKKAFGRTAMWNSFDGTETEEAKKYVESP